MDKNRIRLSQALEGYFLAANARRLAPGTLADYDNTFRKFEAFFGHDPPLASITPNDIRQFLNSLDGLSEKTVLNHHTGLSALWTWAHKESLVEEQIIRAIDAPRPDKRAIVPYSQADVKAMLAACDRTQAYARPGKAKCDNERPTALRDRAIITLLFDTGIRASELTNLRLRDVDLNNERIMVMGKGRKERVLPICPKTARVLWRYLVTRDDQGANNFLFTTRTGRPMERNSLRQILQRIGERAGVPGANVHRFRHTFAICFLRNGGHMLALQRMLGHSTLDMVQRYLALAQTDIEKAHRDASPVANWLV